MCFSATASFAVAGGLLPVAAGSLMAARRLDRRWMPFAVYPLAFSLQQALEGAVWIALASGDGALLGAGARGFLFFSHFFWLVWVPFSMLPLESVPSRRRALAALTVFGGLFGASLLAPVLLGLTELSVLVVHQSINYAGSLIYDGLVGRDVLKVVYAGIIVGALMISSQQRMRFFAILMLISVIAAYRYFDHAFTSVWCFFAAVLSLCVLFIVMREARAGQPFSPAPRAGN